MYAVHFENLKNKSFDSLDFIKETFLKNEILYSKSKKYPKMHFLGIYCAKKAVKKILMEKTSLKEIKIAHELNGKPVAYINNRKFTGDISIAHTEYMAGAAAILK